jgi:hypothetical protein
VTESRFVLVAPGWWVSNFGGAIATGVLALRRPSRLTRFVFVGTVTTHAAEAVYAYRAARRRGPDADAWKWALQTLAVGFPSLLALHEVIQEDRWSP